MLRLAFILLLASALGSCSRDDNEVNSFSCAELQLAVLNQDLPMMKRVVEPLMASLGQPLNFSQGQDQLMSVAGFLSECDQAEASLLCFECIQTLPAQSELLVKIVTATGIRSAIIDISRDKDGVLRVVNLHN